ncbi:MAG: hypothetical protein QHG98_07320 [Methanothrix sp.]|nr:hypothetical protein [Methanothrix sp.]
MAELDPVVVEAFVEAHGALSAILKNVGQPGDREYIALHRQHAARRALQKIWKAVIQVEGSEAIDKYVKLFGLDEVDGNESGA